MSIIKTLSVIILNVLAFTVSGQNILIRPWTGIGTYAMSDLKSIQKELQNVNDISLKGTDNYPPFICFGFDIIPTLTKNFGLGLTSSYHSTGARNHYADYSGSITEDFLINDLNLGIDGIFTKTISKNLLLSGEIKSGIKFTKLQTNSSLILFEQTETENQSFKSESWWIEPQINIEKQLIKNIYVYLFLGYEFNTKGTLFLTSNHDLYLQINNSKASADWSGLRAGIGISLKIRTKKPESNDTGL
ncbi:MAG TPA: hypothetical protein PLC80_12710 [Draconibacterium sp.]|nr:hypothetical protein [Draconibacterium sp.]